MNNKLLFKVILLLGIIVLNLGCEKENTTPGSKVEARTFSISSWPYSSPEYYQDLSVPELTSSNINSASVNVYFSIDGGANWTSLPFTQYNSSGSNYFMNFTTRVGAVRISWIYNTSLSKGYDPNSYYGTNVQFKVVVISSAAKKANSDLDYNNYEQVKTRFKLAN